jgi:DNA-binding MarR family transcriptional regulator
MKGGICMENAEIAKKLYGSFEKFRHMMKGPPSFGGLKPSEIGLLFHIKGGCSNEPDGIKVSELSTKMHVTSPSITQLVTSLEERGLVERNMDREDRRSVKVSLTDKGNEITKKAEENLMGALTGLVEYLGPDKSQALTDILNDVFAYFQQGINKGVD